LPCGEEKRQPARLKFAPELGAGTKTIGKLRILEFSKGFKTAAQ
jgi:hypothetical protein